MSAMLISLTMGALMVVAGTVEASELADPTRPVDAEVPVAVAPADSPLPLRLSIIKVSAQGRAAVVNGTLVHEGDVVEGSRVLSIDRDGVIVITVDGTRRALALAMTPVKRAPDGGGGGTDAETRVAYTQTGIAP